MRDIIQTADLSTRQLIFFYELCKRGIVRFDLNNVSHEKLLAHMIKLIGSYNPKSYKDEPEAVQAERTAKHQLHCLILMQIWRFTIPRK